MFALDNGSHLAKRCFIYSADLFSPNWINVDVIAVQITDPVQDMFPIFGPFKFWHGFEYFHSFCQSVIYCYALRLKPPCSYFVYLLFYCSLRCFPLIIPYTVLLTKFFGYPFFWSILKKQLLFCALNSVVLPWVPAPLRTVQLLDCLYLLE